MKVRSTLILALLLCGSYILQAQTKIFVNASASGANNGTDWADAYTDFQAGINAAIAGDSIFVAGGTYLPSTYFIMKEGVKIYGGFAGTESSLSQRNLAADIAAGDSSVLIGNGNTVIVNTTNNLSPAAVLDGFTITGGTAGVDGAGMSNNNSSPTLTNLLFENNIATDGGGGIANNNSSPILTNVTFANNRAEGGDGGGAIFNGNSSPILRDVVFVNNSTTTYGGAIEDISSSPTLTNVTFSNNSAGNGGAIDNYLGSSPTITNAVFWGNAGNHIDIDQEDNSLTITYSFTQTAQTGTGDTTGTIDPFVDSANAAGADGIYGTADDGLELLTGGAAIDSGTPDTTGLGLPATDITGAARISNSRIDMGAYEHQVSAPLPVTILSFNGALHNSIVQLQWRTTNEINLNHFEIERSSDGIHYTPLTTVAADGNGTVNNYATVDASPLPIIDYYRLKSVDNNGSFAYSTTVTVNINGNESVPLIVYPKPATSLLTVNYAPATSDAVLTIYSLNGQKLSTVPMGGSTQATIDVSSLSAGEYIIKYQSSTVTLTDKFTKVD